MATITGLTANRMIAIEGASIVDGEIIDGNLILFKYNGEQIDAGPVIGPQGPQGPIGPAGGLIPGEIRLWSGSVLPEVVNYGKWVWADGAVYAVASYPIAASHIAAAWKTFGGASDPGAGNFRVPDLRGLVPAGLDAMPGGSRANRMTRSVAIILAGKTGEETHVITLPEMAQHSHTVNDPGHNHTVNYRDRFETNGNSNLVLDYVNTGTIPLPGGTNVTGITIQNAGGNNDHENVQPTVFVPYIVKLDD